MGSASKLVVIGATAYPETAEIIRDINQDRRTYEVIAILDDNSKLHGQAIEDVPVVGGLERAIDFSNAQFVFCIGSAQLRMARYEILRKLGIETTRFQTLIHPAAKVYSNACIGNGTIVFPHATIFCGARVSNFVQVLATSVVGVRNILSEGALVASLVTTGSDVHIGAYSHIGTGSVIVDGISVGPGAQVGAGSVVLRDIPTGAFCLGNPAKVIRVEDVPGAIQSIHAE